MMNSLNKRFLGHTNIQLTELGFGGAGLGNLYREVSDEAVEDSLDATWLNGIRYFDTAPYYGFGLSEIRLGNYLQNLNRNRYVLSSKVGRLLKPVDQVNSTAMRHGFCSSMPFEPVYDYSYDGIMQSFDGSLLRLGLDSIDILFIHDIGELTHGDNHTEIFRTAMDSGYLALDELRNDGRIKAVGIGVNEWEACDQAMNYGQFDCFLLAGRYTLLEQAALERFLPRCHSHGASVIIGGAYNSGILATGTKSGKPLYYDYQPAPESIIERVRQIELICHEFDIPLAAAALQFPLAHPAISSVIPGLSSPTHVEQTLALHRHPIPYDLWQALRDADLIHPDAPLPKQNAGVA